MAAVLTSGAGAAEAVQVLDGKMHHLRSDATREWDDFPEKAEGPRLTIHFAATRNLAESTLRLRHRDLKQGWVLRLNSKEFAKLPLDENEMTTFWPVPAGALRDGDNEFSIACTGGPSDDVMVGEITLLNESRKLALSEATVDVTVTDNGSPTPCRITIADARAGLMSLEASSESAMAVRPGVVYTASGHVRLSLPAGRYTLYAGRGVAYSLDTARIDLRPGDALQQTLTIHRAVGLKDYVACDTHIHTWTHSHHGDATIEERMVTLAGEGVELPIATDHNLQIDYEPIARAAGLRNYFTPVIGNEVTTASLGHFNVFPIDKDAKLIDWRVHDWAGLSRNIHAVAADPVIILNHARDTHGKFRPFDPSRHISFTGEELDGQEVLANAMEVINSGSTQTDSMQLCRDWFGMLNRGHRITPIGASDSHDVSRYIAGQARTYVKSSGVNDPAKLDADAMVKNLREGRVLVSYGLVANIEVERRYGPGDVVPSSALKDQLSVEVTVQAPKWSRATHVTLYANGVPAEEAEIGKGVDDVEAGRFSWNHRYQLPKPTHDVYFVAVATGPGIDKPFWPCAKPYQPASPHWKSYVMGGSGAVYLNTDGTGKFKCAYDQATELVSACHGDLATVIAKLTDYDEATSGQAASILQKVMPARFEEKAKAALPNAAPAARAGFERFLKEWAESVAAREQ